MDTDHGWRDNNDINISESSDSRRSRYNSSESARGGRGGRRTRGSSSNQDGNKENLRNRPFDKKVAKYGIGYQKIENLCKDMDQGKVLSGSADLLTAVQAESFYVRLDDLWPDLEKQANLLRVIVATASTDQRDLLNLTHDFISKVIGSKLVHSIVGKCICPMMYDSQMQENPVCARIANYIVKLLLLGYQLLPSTMDPHLSDVVGAVTSLKAVKDECLEEETKNELERLEIALKARQEAKTAQRLTEDKRKQENKEFVGSVGEPPKNFREISVVPIPEDIRHEISPYLRPAKVKGRYQSDEQYLDILFRLLREDLIRPLRDGIAAYRKGGTKETDLYVYRDVEIGESFMHKKTGELLSTASINVLKRMRWDKRLKYGSLVCFSSDDFQDSFLFATVLERDDLPNGKVGLKFEDILKVNTKLKYKMVESPAFFEAYRHVMTALQAIKEGEPIPFTSYLVDVETTTKPPSYSTDKRFDFKSLLKTDRQNTEFFLHEIRRLKPDDFGMDESQFDALLYTLTTELAIIQGPPGTGKTFMGLQIVKLLFDNWSIWNPDQRDCRPLLVVCYTNHALDQFLEGISEFIEDGIVRVGGRCKNDKVAQFNLSRARRWDNPTIRNQFYNYKEEIDFARRELQEASTTLKAVESRFASPLQLSRTFCNEEKRCSKNNFFGWDTGDTSMFKWLTQTDQIYPMTIYDINIIRQLIDWDIPEIKAKNILADAYDHNYLPDAESLYYFLQGPGGDHYSDTEISANAKLWPKTDDIDQVKILGYSDNVAAELLVGMSVDEIREEHIRSNGTKATTSQQLSNVTALLEQLDISEHSPETDNKGEEVDELAFKDDDEENRKIFDTDVMEDFQERKGEPDEVKEVDWFNAEILKNFLEHITSAKPMTEEECNEIEDIWALPLQKRWKLYQFWIKKCHEEVKERIKKLEEEYSKKMKLLVDFRSLADVDVLKSAKVVGMTTTGAAKLQSTLRALRPKIVIVEEAAEVLEAHSLTSLTSACQHLILIGDHKQLRPSAAVYELARKYHMEVSLFERLINNGYPYKMLKNQHRMCPDISRVLMPHFYQDLKDDPSVFEKESVKGVTKNLLFINHSYPELTEKEFKSHKNLFEAEYAIQLARYFLQQNYRAEQITILCTYLDQLLELRKKANEKFGKEHGLVIQSVDNYQGEENDIVILSLVRSNNPENKIGFLKIPNRVCVALSRAKLGLYVICNMDFFANNCELWNEIRNSAVKADALKNELIIRCQKHQTEQAIQHYNDFGIKSREGGCHILCNGRLECGHQCIKPCHVEDMDHTSQKCFKRCEKKCKSVFEHPCLKDCWKECGNCEIKVLKRLPCGHEKIDSCFLDATDVQCSKDCQKILPCGHLCKEKCGSECTKFCEEIVKRRLPDCGHFVSMKCGEKITSVKCKAAVTKKWPFCKHTVETFCSSNVTALPCPQPCNTVLSDCEHLCNGTCGKCRKGRLHIACSENCNKIFLCEHKCEAKCSKVCPPCSKPCETECGHSQCGNQPIKGEQQKKTRKVINQQKGSKSGRRCGEPCPPCKEPCLNQCEHRKCTKKCGDPCNVKPCSEPCMKLLPCNPKLNENNVDDSSLVEHRCIGICGEECLKICKICNPEKFSEIQQIFFGTEENKNARFVQLKDCGHIFEVTGLDEWIESSLPKSNKKNDSIEIVQIKCPQCKTSIRRSKRYISILNERAIDIEQIKQKTRGFTNDEKKKEQSKFRGEVKQVFNAFKETDFGKTENVSKLEKMLIEANSNVLTKDWFSSSRNILRIVETLSKYENRALDNIEIFRERNGRIGEEKLEFIKIDDVENMPNFKAQFSQLQINSLWGHLKDECNNLISVIHPNSISRQMIQQIVYEVQRFGFIINLFTYFSKAIKNGVDFTPVGIEMINDIFENMNGSKEFDDNFEKEMSEKLQELAKLHRVSNFGISQKERIEILNAVGTDIRHWYKCPNGHHYGIGQCGEAMEIAKCPECKAQIGGGFHRILDTNFDAQNEMYDGSGIPANRYRNPFFARR